MTPEKLRSILGRHDRDTLLSICEAVRVAGERFVRHATNTAFGDRRATSSKMSQRRTNLESIKRQATELREELLQVDSISKEDFELQNGVEGRERLIGYLVDLAKEADRQLKFAQRTGNPSDLNLDRWVSSIADVYENHFRKSATIWGGEANPGPFYKFLEACRPAEFSRFGELRASRIRSILKRRQRYQPQPRTSKVILPGAQPK